MPAHGWYQDRSRMPDPDMSEADNTPQDDQQDDDSVGEDDR